MSRELCRVSQDPYYDYSDYVEEEGVYSQQQEEDPDDQAEREWLRRA